jgi:hypothetical protein
LEFDVRLLVDHGQQSDTKIFVARGLKPTNEDQAPKLVLCERSELEPTTFTVNKTSISDEVIGLTFDKLETVEPGIEE